jgi:hypothetical protein
MAQVVLSAVGQSVGGPVGRVIGATIGRAIDNRVVGSLSPARQVGPRLDALKVQGTAEGAPMACVFGRARVTGQVIWAARFLEGKNKGQAGKGGPKTVDYDYSLSFAVALCEGEIDGIGRVWADGRLMDLSGVAMRVYRGSEDQTPDPLIEAVEAAVPAYRDTAYVVFEDLPLGSFGDRVPQLSFEVFRRPRGAAARLTVRWTPRVRLYGDSWDGEPTPVEPMRFRIQVVDGGTVIRSMEAEETLLVYSAADLASDFPAGAPASARILVAQWGEGFGWGVEAEIRLA